MAAWVRFGAADGSGIRARYSPIVFVAAAVVMELYALSSTLTRGNWMQHRDTLASALVGFVLVTAMSVSTLRDRFGKASVERKPTRGSSRLSAAYEIADVDARRRALRSLVREGYAKLALIVIILVALAALIPALGPEMGLATMSAVLGALSVMVKLSERIRTLRN